MVRKCFFTCFSNHFHPNRFTLNDIRISIGCVISALLDAEPRNLLILNDIPARTEKPGPRSERNGYIMSEIARKLLAILPDLLGFLSLCM